MWPRGSRWRLACLTGAILQETRRGGEWEIKNANITLAFSEPFCRVLLWDAFGDHLHISFILVVAGDKQENWIYNDHEEEWTPEM